MVAVDTYSIGDQIGRGEGGGADDHGISLPGALREACLHLFGEVERLHGGVGRDCDPQLARGLGGGLDQIDEAGAQTEEQP